MPSLLILCVRFFRTIRDGLKDPEFRGLFYWVAGILGLGLISGFIVLLAEQMDVTKKEDQEEKKD